MPFEPALDVTAEASVRIGRTLRNKWHLDALIDVGGMAAVYAATHRNGMRGAVKILHRHRSLEPETAARFRREGFIANKVAHPNVVRVLDDDTDDDGSVFLVMELLEGSTLRDRAGASGGTLTAAEVLLAVDQLLDVLAVAHDASIIHRDIKPDNVFVTTDGQVKMLDFGIAKLFDPAAKHSETVTGLPMGSPAFMSPEQARGRWDIVDVQSDVWAVGATMFTLLTGKDVHTADTVPGAPGRDLHEAGSASGERDPGLASRRRVHRRPRAPATARGPLAGCPNDAGGGPDGLPRDVRQRSSRPPADSARPRPERLPARYCAREPRAGDRRYHRHRRGHSDRRCPSVRTTHRDGVSSRAGRSARHRRSGPRRP